MKEGKWGNQRRSLPFIGRVQSHIRLYKELKNGGAEDERRRGKFPRSPGGKTAVLYHDPPPLPPQFQILPAARVKLVKISSTGPLLGAVSQKSVIQPVERNSVGW